MSLCDDLGISATAGGTAATDFLESCVAWSAILLNVRDNLEMMPSLQRFHSQKQGQFTSSQIGQVRRVGTTAMYCSPNIEVNPSCSVQPSTNYVEKAAS